MLDPELLPFVEAGRKAWPVPPEQLPVAEYRQRYDAQMIAARRPRAAGLAVQDRELGGVPVRIYRPAADGAARLPAMVFMHGGGWVIGSVESHDEIAAAIAADTGCAVISVEYRRAPEHPFPHALDDSLAVVRAAAAQAGELGIDAARLLVGGDSAGGNLAAAIALALRGGDVALHGQVLLYPSLGADFDTASFVENAAGPVITAPQVRWFFDQYLPDPANRRDPLALPLLADSLRGLPPAFIGVAQNDPIRDDGIAYAQRLRDDGVAVQLDTGPGLIHGYVRARHACAAAQHSYEAMCGWVRAR